MGSCARYLPYKIPPAHNCFRSGFFPTLRQLNKMVFEMFDNSISRQNGTTFFAMLKTISTYIVGVFAAARQFIVLISGARATSGIGMRVRSGGDNALAVERLFIP
ncbi:hypothetical protein GYMLUDRAFT_47325 [Collybiopsis luxurians FD-317 M1]|uniref:Unplaced genomic scaffold GYMLUscaffold_52, whole genome shotgun sequence n=1 Tax=Collybiopsis luxurians FD-317 M1 TaxID=944289 RepID=A0A0D0CDI0_9AGAR|nr:hypothetical protein GYMLUDRAFT_47325 [Collybiopsis luxurians FD-317 M1]